jgi:hypothetical protein
MVEVETIPQDMMKKYRYKVCRTTPVSNSDLDEDTFVCARTSDAAGAHGAYEVLRALGDKEVPVVIETTGEAASISIGEGMLDITLDGENLLELLPRPDDYSGINKDLGIRWDTEETEHSEVMFESVHNSGYYIFTTLENYDDPAELFLVRRPFDHDSTPEIEGDSFMAESARRKLKKGAKEIAVPAVEGAQPKTPQPTQATKKKLVTEDQVREAMMVMDAEKAADKKAEDTPATDDTKGTKSTGSKAKRRSKDQVRLDNIADAMNMLWMERDAEDIRKEILSTAVAIVEHNGREVVITDDEAEQSLLGTLNALVLDTDRIRQRAQHALATADVPEAPVETPEDFRKRAIALLISEVV